MSSNEQLERIFKSYTKGKEMMYGREFVKIFKDAKLCPKPVPQTDADLVFVKLGKTQKRINLAQFVEAIRLIAERAKVEESLLLEKISSLEGPILVGTKAEDVRFHDDKSTYTGTHKFGGPSTMDVAAVSRSGGAITGGDKHTMASLTNRGNCDIRGVPIKEAPNRD